MICVTNFKLPQFMYSILSLITFWSSPPNSSKTWKAKKPSALWKNRGITRSNSGVCVPYEYILCFVCSKVAVQEEAHKDGKEEDLPSPSLEGGSKWGMPNQIQMSPTLTEIWQQSMERISNKSHYHIMKCTSLLTSQHDCLDLCNQMVMWEEGVSRVAKTNSNVPHFARDLATK